MLLMPIRSKADPGDVDTSKAFLLAQALCGSLESSNVTINEAMTAIANVTAAVLRPLSDEDFETTLSLFAQATRINRAIASKPKALN